MGLWHFAEYDEKAPFWKKHTPVLQAPHLHFRRFLEPQVQNSSLWSPLPSEAELVQPRETGEGDSLLEVKEWRAGNKIRPLSTEIDSYTPRDQRMSDCQGALPKGIQVKLYPLRPREANIQLHPRASRGGKRPHFPRESLTKAISDLTFGETCCTRLVTHTKGYCKAPVLGG